MRIQQTSSSFSDTTVMELDLCVLSLNCWGIPGISRDRVPRMEAIAQEIATGKYDFVFLQEVWSTDDYKLICRKTESVMPYSHYFFSGVIGSGICIFSKSAIQDVFFHQWAVNGYIHKIQHGDWFGGKGVGLARVHHRGVDINLYTTHLHAQYLPYSSNPQSVDDEYKAHRVTQAFDTAQFVRLTGDSGEVSIFGGDFNMQPTDLEYKILKYNGEMNDAFTFREWTCPGPTCETPQNSYTVRSQLRGNPDGIRIDYIMYRPGEHTEVDVVDFAHPLPSRVPGQNFSYSDHEAVCAVLRIRKSVTSREKTTNCADQRSSLMEGIDVCTLALRKLHRDKVFYWIASALILCLLLGTINLDLPYNLRFLLAAGRILFSVVFTFTFLMGTIWNRTEVHGILSGKLGMEAVKKRLEFEHPEIKDDCDLLDE